MIIIQQSWLYHHISYIYIYPIIIAWPFFPSFLPLVKSQGTATEYLDGYLAQAKASEVFSVASSKAQARQYIHKYGPVFFKTVYFCEFWYTLA